TGGQLAQACHQGDQHRARLAVLHQPTGDVGEEAVVGSEVQIRQAHVRDVRHAPTPFAPQGPRLTEPAQTVVGGSNRFRPVRSKTRWMDGAWLRMLTVEPVCWPVRMAPTSTPRVLASTNVTSAR